MESESTSSQKLLKKAAQVFLTVRRPQPQQTRADQEVPLVFRENFMVSGYRVPGRSWKYYLSSLFHIHNESGNVWTHFLALFIFIGRVYMLGSHLDNWKEPLSWPIVGFTCGIISYAILSTFAHLYQSMSPLMHYTCFQIDYIGIGLNGYGTACLLYYMTGTEDYYKLVTPFAFTVVNISFAVIVCVCCSIAKLRYRRPYPAQRKIWQMGSVGCHVVFGALPVLCRVYVCAFEPSKCYGWTPVKYISPAFFFVMAGVFFVSAFPERLSPGTFDIIGHGHQIFHVFMIFTSLLQIRAALLEIPKRPDILTKLAPPSLQAIVGGVGLVLLLNIIFIVFTHRHRLKKVKDDDVYEQRCNNKNSSNVHVQKDE